MSKFNFTEWGNALYKDGDEISTSMYCERTTKHGNNVLLIIKITMRASMHSTVSFRNYIDDRLILEEVEHYTDTMELVQRIKKYIEERDE